MNLKRLFLITLILGWFAGCVIVISTTIGYTPFRLKAANKINAFQIIPQGWGFFTRNPREEKLILYQVVNDSLQKITQPNFCSDNLYGLSREGRMRQMQMGHLILPFHSRWQSCQDKTIAACIPDTILTVENSFEHSLMKGDYLIKKQATIPWAWSRNRKDKLNPYEILALRVQ